MYYSVTSVTPKDNYELLICFTNKEQKIFDVKPYLDFGDFKELKDKELFKSVRVSFDSIEWDNELDIDPETLYEDGITI